jgi:hypothetical protein
MVEIVPEAVDTLYVPGHPPINHNFLIYPDY